MLKTIVITAGGTAEPIDNVRKITNMSTGKLGATICNTLFEEMSDQIAKVYYMCSSTAVRPKENSKIETIVVGGTYDLKEKVEKLLKEVKVDFFIHSMAVSDYTTDYVSSTERMTEEIVEKVWAAKDNLTKEDLRKLVREVEDCPDNKLSREKKMSSNENGMIIKLKQTPKVIGVIKELQPEVVLFGFKLLSDVSKKELLNVASHLMEKNNCDYVVANDLAQIKQGSHEAIVLDKYGEKFYASGKDAIAYTLVNIMKHY